MTVSNMPTVSVIIPTHDRNDFLDRGVLSDLWLHSLCGP